MATNKKIYAIRRFIYLFLFILLFYYPPSGSVRAEVTLDGTLGPSGAIPGPDYQITADLGQQVGANLFHSFGKFNVNTGEGAIFSGPGSIGNIISRVTGGTSSWIDGYLRSEITGANLYLINPAGVMFGPNASLDVSGSFHVSTADYLTLSDGGVFYADLEQTSTLTSAPPEAFGFLNNNPAGILIYESALGVPIGESLSVIGGDIEIRGGTFGYLSAQSGQISIVSVASEGEVTSLSEGMNVDSFEELGDINIHTYGWIQTSGYPAGSVVIRGGSLTMDGSYIYSESYGASDAGPIIIDMRKDVALTNGAEIESVAMDQGKAGDMYIIASESISLDDGALTSGTWSDGLAGDIYVGEKSNLSLSNGSSIINGTLGYGDAGDVLLNLESLSLTDGSSITSNAFYFDGTDFIETPGEGGDITIFADDSVSISGRSPSGLPSIISTQSFSSTRSGGVAIWATDLSMNDAMIQTQNIGSGGSGLLVIGVDRLTLTEGARINTDNFGPAPGTWNPIIAEESIFISGQSIDGTASGISSSAFGSGSGCTVGLETPSLNMNDGAIIAAATAGTGEGGLLNFNVDTLTLAGGAYVNTTSYGSGNAGWIMVDASDSITISGQSTDGFPSALISNAEGSGDGGVIFIETPTLNMDEGGRIQSVGTADGNAGYISLNVENMTLREGANVNSDSYGTGEGGKIFLSASDSVSISGQISDGFLSGLYSNAWDIGSGGYISVETPTLLLDNGGTIQAGTSGDGNAGFISLDVGGLTIMEGAYVIGNSNSTGHAGDITINASDFLLIDGSYPTGILSQAQSQGNAGSISIKAPMISVENGGAISCATIGEGKGGSIIVSASGLFSVSGTNSGIFTTTEGSGDGGNIDVSAQNVWLSEGALITAESIGSGDAGSITMTIGDTYLSRDSYLTTEATQADGGNIEIKAPELVYLFNSDITTSVQGGLGNGGNIAIDPRFVILNNSSIIANAYGGNGGNIDIVSDYFLSSTDSLVQASSQLGISGTINIAAPDIDLSGSLTVLPSNYLDATSLLRDRCEAMSEENTSSLVIEGRGGMPIEPDDYLPSQ